jgi:trk system potassium uptake protein TrkH
VYLGIVVASITTIAINIRAMSASTSEAIRNSAFQVASIISTAGFTTTNYDIWPGFSKAILLILMFTGACAGSTAGGLKLSRILLWFKMVRNELRHLLSSRSVNSIKVDGKQVDQSVQKNAANYMILFFFIFVIIFLVLSFEQLSFETNFTAVAACINNVGPGFGAVGPSGNFAMYSPLSKIVLSFAMLFGRLELYPMILLFSPSIWRKK